MRDKIFHCVHVYFVVNGYKTKYNKKKLSSALTMSCNKVHGSSCIFSVFILISIS